ncbi:MAG: hypothetical protein KGZ93_09345 [Actinobacteria bacterium]|jgi:uncharacterized membrane protein YhhN|nr:hypothetical protein [Actinomycetota bacterium]
MIDQNVYGYGHIFQLLISLVAFVFLLANRPRLKHYDQYPYYLAGVALFLVASIFYVGSIYAGNVFLHILAGATQSLSIVAVVALVRNTSLKDKRNA